METLLSRLKRLLPHLHWFEAKDGSGHVEAIIQVKVNVAGPDAECNDPSLVRFVQDDARNALALQVEPAALAAPAGPKELTS